MMLKGQWPGEIKAATLKAAGTGGANRPAGSVTGIGTVTGRHSGGTQMLVGRVLHLWARNSYPIQGSLSCSGHWGGVGGARSPWRRTMAWAWTRGHTHHSVSALEACQPNQGMHTGCCCHCPPGLHALFLCTSLWPWPKAFASACHRSLGQVQGKCSYRKEEAGWERSFRS